MKIAVLSPIPKSGCSTLAVLLAYAMKSRHSQSVLLCQVRSSLRLNNYLGLEKSKDISKAIPQIVDLLKVGAIKSSEINEYTLKRGEVGLLDSATSQLTEERSAEMLSDILNYINDEICIVDLNSDFSNKALENIMNQIDFFVIPVTQDVMDYKVMEAYKSHPYFDIIDKKGYIYVINKYNPKIAPQKKIVKALESKLNLCKRMTYTPYFTYLSNKGDLYKAVDLMINQNSDLVRQYSDLVTILNAITKNFGYVLDWRKDK